MPIAIAALLLACGQPDPSVEALPPLPEGPSCERAWETTVRSVAALHEAADKPAPALPDRATWIGVCEAMNLSEPQLGCLEPDLASADPEACAGAFEDTDRSALVQPFLDTLLSQESP